MTSKKLIFATLLLIVLLAMPVYAGVTDWFRSETNDDYLIMTENKGGVLGIEGDPFMTEYIIKKPRDFTEQETKDFSFKVIKPRSRWENIEKIWYEGEMWHNFTEQLPLIENITFDCSNVDNSTQTCSREIINGYREHSYMKKDNISIGIPDIQAWLRDAHVGDELRFRIYGTIDCKGQLQGCRADLDNIPTWQSPNGLRDYTEYAAWNHNSSTLKLMHITITNPDGIVHNEELINFSIVNLNHSTIDGHDIRMVYQNTTAIPCQLTNNASIQCLNQIDNLTANEVNEEFDLYYGTADSTYQNVTIIDIYEGFESPSGLWITSGTSGGDPRETTTALEGLYSADGTSHSFNNMPVNTSNVENNGTDGYFLNWNITEAYIEIYVSIDSTGSGKPMIVDKNLFVTGDQTIDGIGTSLANPNLNYLNSVPDWADTTFDAPIDATWWALRSWKVPSPTSCKFLINNSVIVNGDCEPNDMYYLAMDIKNGAYIDEMRISHNQGGNKQAYAFRTYLSNGTSPATITFGDEQTFVVAGEVPTFEAIESFTLDEDFGTFELNLSINVSDLQDPDRDLDFSIVNFSGPIEFDLNGDDLLNTTGNFTILSHPNTTGSTEVNITVIDTDGNIASTYFNITITAIDDPPTVPLLNEPINASKVSIVNPEFNWTNSSDSNQAENNPSTYLLEISTDPTFPDTTYFNDSIAETANTTGDNSITGLSNNTYYWRVLAFNTTNSSFSEIRVITLETDAILEEFDTEFEAPVVESSSQTFSTNISYHNLSVITVDADFIYNDTGFTVSNKDQIDNDTLRFNITINIPNTDTDPLTNPFFWNFTIKYQNLSIGQQFSRNYTQNVNQINITLGCDFATAAEGLALNFTVVTEPNRTTRFGVVNDTVWSKDLLMDYESNFEIWIDDPSENKSFNFGIQNITSTQVCINPANETYRTEAHIQYVSPTFDTRDYFLRNSTLNNETDFIDLFLLEIALADDIKFSLDGISGDALEAHILEIERQDVANDTFTTVAMGKTDSAGETVTFLRKNDAWYRFNVIDLFGKQVFQTLKTQINSDELSIRITEDTLADLLEKVENVETILQYINTTGNFQLGFEDPSQTVTSACLKVLRRSGLQEEVICDSCLNAISGTITCHTDNITGLYIATAYSQFSAETTLDSLSKNVDFVGLFHETAGLNGVFVLLFIAGTITFAAIGQPVIAVGFLLITITIGSILGLFGLSYVALISIIGVGVIIVIRLRN
tara:strand:+ start:2668 stop:6384 length:3717 start_codon:yes stop_codon:yes gene_type:complete